MTLSLGDGCSPGSLHDATDKVQVQEMIVLGELTKRAWERNVQVMIEGPGHMALYEIAANMVLEKRLCHGAPLPARTTKIHTPSAARCARSGP